MNGTKHPLKSLGIMGPLLALLVFSANQIHPGLGLTTDELGPVIDGADVIVGFVMAIYGRWRATSQISMKGA